MGLLVASTAPPLTDPALGKGRDAPSTRLSCLPHPISHTLLTQNAPGSPPSPTLVPGGCLSPHSASLCPEHPVLPKPWQPPFLPATLQAFRPGSWSQEPPGEDRSQMQGGGALPGP